MNSLKPKGDSIAHEFYNLMKKAEKNFPAEDSLTEEALDEAYDKASAPGAIAEALGLMGEAFSEGPPEMPDPNYENLKDADLKGMLIQEDSALDSSMLKGIDEAYEAISKAEDGMMHTASEQRVLDGLQKIAAGLRAKGEGFASDVVLATANSIKGDLKKKAEQRSAMIDGLQKVAKEFYAEGEQLAGDMVSITINKISQVTELSKEAQIDAMFGDMSGMEAGTARPSSPRSQGDSDLDVGEVGREFTETYDRFNKTHYPKTPQDIPRVYKLLVQERAKSPAKEMEINEKYGLKSESKSIDGMMQVVFELQSGKEAKNRVPVPGKK